MGQSLRKPVRVGGNQGAGALWGLTNRRCGLSKAPSGMRFRPVEECAQQREQESSQCRGPEMGMSVGFCRKKQEASMAGVDEQGGG